MPAVSAVSAGVPVVPAAVRVVPAQFGRLLPGERVMGQLWRVLLCSECALLSERLFSLMRAPLHAGIELRAGLTSRSRGCLNPAAGVLHCYCYYYSSLGACSL